MRPGRQVLVRQVVVERDIVGAVTRQYPRQQHRRRPVLSRHRQHDAPTLEMPRIALGLVLLLAEPTQDVEHHRHDAPGVLVRPQERGGVLGPLEPMRWRPQLGKVVCGLIGLLWRVKDGKEVILTRRSTVTDRHRALLSRACSLSDTALQETLVVSGVHAAACAPASDGRGAISDDWKPVCIRHVEIAHAWRRRVPHGGASRYGLPSANAAQPTRRHIPRAASRWRRHRQHVTCQRPSSEPLELRGRDPLLTPHDQRIGEGDPYPASGGPRRASPDRWMCPLCPLAIAR